MSSRDRFIEVPRITNTYITLHLINTSMIEQGYKLIV